MKSRSLISGLSYGVAALAVAATVAMSFDGRPSDVPELVAPSVSTSVTAATDGATELSAMLAGSAVGFRGVDFGRRLPISNFIPGIDTNAYPFPPIGGGGDSGHYYYYGHYYR